jgi:hypothetical protein
MLGHILGAGIVEAITSLGNQVPALAIMAALFASFLAFIKWAMRQHREERNESLAASRTEREAHNQIIQKLFREHNTEREHAREIIEKNTAALTENSRVSTDLCESIREQTRVLHNASR